MRTERQELIELIALADEIDRRSRILDSHLAGTWLLRRHIREVVNQLHELRRLSDDSEPGLFDLT